jgi:hypothetical protein
MALRAAFIPAWSSLTTGSLASELQLPKASHGSADSNDDRLMTMPLRRLQGSRIPQPIEAAAEPFKKPYI